MKHLTRIASIVCCLFLFFGVAKGQVIADFETDVNGFEIGWGDAITNVYQTTDPTGLSAGVLALDFNAATTTENKGAVQKTNIEVDDAHSILFYIYLPADTPDSILVKTWAQDQSWTWFDFKFYTVDIPKEIWIPLPFFLKYAPFYNSDFDLSEGPMQKIGIELGTWDLTGDDANWSGTIYLDNVSLVGAEPKYIADFETGTNGFDIGWGDAITSVAQAADPTGQSAGVLALDFNAATTTENKGAVQKTNIEVDDAHSILFYIYLPTDTPDSILVKTWAQDQSWTWSDFKQYTVDIPKEVWYPLYFPLDVAHIFNNDFDTAEGPLQKIGIELGTWDLSGDDATWSGTIYLDDVALLGTETGVKWVVAAFENQIAGLQGFSDTGWGAGLRNMEWAADPTGQSDGVMKTDWDFTQGEKGAFEHGNVDLQWTDTDTATTEITIDLWLPEDITHGAQVSMFLRDHATWTWTEDKFFIADTLLKPGQWNTITYDVMAHVEAGEVDPTAGASVGCQIYYAEATDWTGSVYWDNFTLIGAEEPVGEIVSPTVAVEIDTSETTTPPYQYVHITWVDNSVGTESYNVYVSESSIDDLSAPGVIRLTNDIPHGEQFWNHRPWTNDGSERTYYYAVTANNPDGTETELTNECKAGPFTLPTSVNAKASYDADFSTKFTLDGLDTEFTEYAAYKLQPENAGGDESTGWTKESTDLTWNTTFVVDDDYLYISADVTDDDLNAVGDQPLLDGTQPWMGDALEFFIGYYNVNLLDDYHNYKDVDKEGTGDWRIAFTAWGTTGTATNIDKKFPGVETTVFQKFTGDGYIIEARIELDSLAMNNDFVVVDGARMPMQINCNDLDPDNGDTERTLQANWGTQSGHEAWKRPGAWGFLEVINGPTSVDEVKKSIPLDFRLYANFPNPFNPTTTLKYELAITSEVSLVIYDLLGNKVKTLVNGQKEAGTYSIQWDGKNDAGIAVPSGVYFYKMKAQKFTQTQKMMFLK